MYENDYDEQLAKISTCVKYSADAYYKYIFSFCFGNLNSHDCDGDSLNAMIVQFPNCFLPFLLVFPQVSFGASTVFFGNYNVFPQLVFFLKDIIVLTELISLAKAVVCSYMLKQQYIS